MKKRNTFLWGVATAAYQIEGAVNEDNRGKSIWDTFSHEEGKTYIGQTGDEACDHFHRFEEDIRLMAELGVNTYRFSIAWPRIFPNGFGQVNQKGLDFYKRLLEQLWKYEIQPMATIYHWDLPQSLQDKGGWKNRDTAEYFAEYAAVLFQTYGESIPFWITHNEPWCSSILGYGIGEHAPGEARIEGALKAAHHLLLSHGKAVQAFRQSSLTKSNIGITLNLTKSFPFHNSQEDLRAAQFFEAQQNQWFLDPILKGTYPSDVLDLFRKQFEMDWIQPGDLKIIQVPIDFLGVNYYSRNIIEAAPEVPPVGIKIVPPQGEVTDMGWEVYPEGLFQLLTQLDQSYGDIPIIITENGAAYPDSLTKDGKIHDSERIDFLMRHLEEVKKAIHSGVNVIGYCVWSLLDNFEWAHGYSKRFGLVYVDYSNQQRIPKDSYFWYRDWIHRNKDGFEKEKQ